MKHTPASLPSSLAWPRTKRTPRCLMRKRRQTMEDLIVVTYRNQYSAVDNIRTLRKLDDDWVVDIHDAVAVARDSYGKLYIQDSYKATSQSGARWGVLLGMLLGGLALAPFTGGLSTTAAAGAIGAGAVGGAAV